MVMKRVEELQKIQAESADKSKSAVEKLKENLEKLKEEQKRLDKEKESKHY